MLLSGGKKNSQEMDQKGVVSYPVMLLSQWEFVTREPMKNHGLYAYCSPPNSSYPHRNILSIL